MVGDQESNGGLTDAQIKQGLEAQRAAFDDNKTREAWLEKIQPKGLAIGLQPDDAARKDLIQKIDEADKKADAALFPHFMRYDGKDVAQVEVERKALVNDDYMPIANLEQVWKNFAKSYNQHFVEEHPELNLKPINTKGLVNDDSLKAAAFVEKFYREKFAHEASQAKDKPQARGSDGLGDIVASLGGSNVVSHQGEVSPIDTPGVKGGSEIRLPGVRS